MSLLHTILEKLHLARHADVFDPAELVRQAEDEFKKAVADAVHGLESRVTNLEQGLGAIAVHPALSIPSVAIDLGMAPLSAAQTSAPIDSERHAAPTESSKLPVPSTTNEGEGNLHTETDAPAAGADSSHEHAHGEDDASQAEHPDNHSAAGHDNGRPGDEHPETGHGG